MDENGSTVTHTGIRIEEVTPNDPADGEKMVVDSFTQSVLKKVYVKATINGASVTKTLEFTFAASNTPPAKPQTLRRS